MRSAEIRLVPKLQFGNAIVPETLFRRAFSFKPKARRGGERRFTNRRCS